MNANELEQDNAGDKECFDEMGSKFEVNLKKTSFLVVLAALRNSLGFGFSYAC